MTIDLWMKSSYNRNKFFPGSIVAREGMEILVGVRDSIANRAEDRG